MSGAILQFDADQRRALAHRLLELQDTDHRLNMATAVVRCRATESYMGLHVALIASDFFYGQQKSTELFGRYLRQLEITHGEDLVGRCLRKAAFNICYNDLPDHRVACIAQHMEQITTDPAGPISA